jgi:hypothetical protein
VARRVRNAYDGGRHWLEKHPAYAPERNPVESLWAHLEEHQITDLLVEIG